MSYKTKTIENTMLRLAVSVFFMLASLSGIMLIKFILT